MSATRVWLTEWEWACCGDSFALGDRITLEVYRNVGDWVPELLGDELAQSIDAIESHHVDPAPDRVSGVVTAIHGVTIEHSERREPRALHQPPPEPVADPQGGWWGLSGSRDPYVTIVEPIPGTAQLHPAPHVPWPPRDGSPVDPTPPRGLSGYLVDVDTD